MKKMILILAAVLLVATATVSAQEGLDPAAPPNYGAFTLEAGFLPDPWIVSAISGGTVDVGLAGIGDGCVGLVSTAPDYTVEYSGVPLSNNLRILYVGSGDTTLVVADPNGNWVCNDDSATTDPLIDFPNPASGVYSIWIGSLTTTTPAHGYLMITEVESVPGAILTDIVGFVTTLVELTGAPAEATIEAEPDITPTPGG